MQISILCVDCRGSEYWKVRNEPLHQIMECGDFIIVEHNRWQTTLVDKKEHPMFIIRG